MSDCPVLVEMRGIVKRYPGVVANDHVDFTLCSGEIHGLLGENGAGKTTLMSILYGSVKPDAGTILVGGSEYKPRSPRDALKRGIVMVHQHFKLVETLTVLDNIVLAARGAGLGYSRAELRERLARVSERYGLYVDPDARVWQLSASEKQKVELARALVLDARILILDEPTTVLAPSEVEGLFDLIRAMKRDGRSIVFITHRLGEALAVCDRITVLRKGRVAGVIDLSRERATPTMLTRIMFGEEPPPPPVRRERRRGRRVLLVEDLWVRGNRGHWAVRAVSFNLFEGEILGIAGVAGNGQLELVEAIVGLRRPERGRILIDGFDATGASARVLVDEGVAYIPEDRVGMGVVPGLTVAENTVLRGYWRRGFYERGVIRWPAVERHAERIVKEFDVKVGSVSFPVETLSGGNIQRLIVGREISLGPRILVAYNPTSGLDARAAAFIRRELAAMADEGAAIILVSEDLDEILMLSDRVGVMYKGVLLGPLTREEASREKVGYMMATGTGV